MSRQDTSHSCRFAIKRSSCSGSKPLTFRRRDSERQEAETWRSLHQFSRNALELSMKRRQQQPVFQDSDGVLNAGMTPLL